MVCYQVLDKRHAWLLFITPVTYGCFSHFAGLVLCWPLLEGPTDPGLSVELLLLVYFAARMGSFRIVSANLHFQVANKKLFLQLSSRQFVALANIYMRKCR